jgi:large subunit ribosomal protein L25
MKFVAFERTQQGTGASRRLRIAGNVPGIVYGAGEPSLFELDHNALFHALKREAFHSSVLDMELAGNVQKVLLRDYHMHAYKPIVMHIDFQRIDETTRIRKKVPLHFQNEENSPAVKTDKCLVSHVANEIEIECLASQLPEFITIDLGELQKGQSLHASDLKLPQGIRRVRHGTLNPVIVAVTVPKDEEAEAAAAEGAEGAVVAAPTAAPAAKAAKTAAAPAKDAKAPAKDAKAPAAGKDAKKK